MTFKDTARCPLCFKVGELKYQNNTYCCYDCDQCWTYTTLAHHNQAFEDGRRFESEKRATDQPPI